jgi:hypothetical protein
VWCWSGGLLSVGVLWLKGALDLSLSRALQYGGGALLGGCIAGYCLGVASSKNTSYSALARRSSGVLACALIGMMTAGLAGFLWGACLGIIGAVLFYAFSRLAGK